MRKVLVCAAVAVIGLMGVSSADDYLNFQKVQVNQKAKNLIDVSHIGDVGQDAVNIGNMADIVDGDAYNDDYESIQLAKLSQLAKNVIEADDFDDIDQSATNVGNLLNIDDADGLYQMGDQDVDIVQRVKATQKALNVAELGDGDDIEQSALNIGNQASVVMATPDLNIVDVENSQMARLSQTAMNSVSAHIADSVSQSATNVGNSFSLEH